MGRSHRSDSSASSGSSDDSKGYKKPKKDKKDKKDKKEKKDKDSKSKDKDKKHKSHGGDADFPSHPPPAYSNSGASFPDPHIGGTRQQEPQAVSGSTPPTSGYRVPLNTESGFPSQDQAGVPPLRDADGSPVFIGSALFPKSVHPCKIIPRLSPAARVPYGGTEHGHNGRYDLLPFVPQQMEWVPASHGRLPQGRRAIEGGYEESGQKLYHALAVVSGVQVPGKAGEHL